MTEPSSTGRAVRRAAPVDDTLIDKLSTTRQELRDEGRRTLGVTGDGENPPTLREMRRLGVKLYPLTALGALSVVDTFHGYAFSVLTPEISRSLGISIGAFTLLVSLKALAGAISPMPSAALVQKVPRRALVIIVSSFAWATATLVTGFSTTFWMLAAILMVDGLTTGAALALHQPLLFDVYPPALRVRSVSFHRAFDNLGNILAPLLVAVFASVFDLTWRGIYVAFGIICLAVVPYALWLRDPGYGRWDTEKLREKVRPSSTDDLPHGDVQLGFFEIFRRLTLIPTLRAIMVGFGVFGMLLIPFQTFLAFFLADDLDLSVGQRGVFAAVSAAAGMVGLAGFGVLGERLFRRDPQLLVRLSAFSLAIGVVSISIAIVLPWTWAVLTLLVVTSTLLSILTPGLGIAALSVVPANMRPHAAALFGILSAGAGGLAGAVLLGGMQSRYGTSGALVSLLLPGVIGSVLVARAGRTVQADMDRLIDDVLEEEQLHQLRESGGRLPMLSCRKIDFSYGPMQVLFDVDFTVDDGEMVALLGTNGAGKSTLLKVISGIGLPTSGTVRYRGQDITYLDAERRTRLGITQVPGGRAVFGPLTVAENLRSYGFALGQDRRNLDALVDECFEAFPRLYERRNSLAAQLSGGEQQMLGLSKALVLKPRLLIIDELSLGLAPVVVGQLLEMVRQINSTGTAVVLVEQSVNIALSLVDHAYFMEKGEMRFDGRASDLLERDDLLRAVFLEGAAAAT